MTIACTNNENKDCPHRRAGLCFNPCALRAASDALKLASDVADGKVERIEKLDF